jgi:hypothetical protein
LYATIKVDKYYRQEWNACLNKINDDYFYENVIKIVCWEKYKYHELEMNITNINFGVCVCLYKLH